MNNEQVDAVVVNPAATADACVIWLHGLGADGHDFEAVLPALGLPEQHGIRFVFPHAPVQPVTINGGMAMRAWYDITAPDLTVAPDRDGIENSISITGRLIEEQVATGISANRIVLAGFSQGGAIALHTGLNYPQALAGILALSTYLPLPDRIPQAQIDADLAIFMAHGQKDPLIPVTVGESSWQQLTDAGYKAEWKVYNIEHSVSLDEIRDIGAWLAGLLG